MAEDSNIGTDCSFSQQTRESYSTGRVIMTVEIDASNYHSLMSLNIEISY